MQFPLYAGGMLCGLYGLIKYFGKEVVNPLLLGYMGIGASQSIKGLLLSLSIGTNLDKKKLIKCKIEKIGLDLEVSPLDLICLVPAYMAVGVYIYSKNWIYNNILALLFCVHGIEFLFLGNFTTGFILLGLLFFYDIFFVFGTDVMLTVAKSIDAPIKLLFPKDWETTPPQFSLLGLGDIVIPGVFIALCLRYDIIKSLNKNKLTELVNNGQGDQFIQMLHHHAATAPRHYFYGGLIGYMVAIITTVIIMLVFEHGQPALLYLVPACLLSVIINALRFGEFKKIWDFNEEEIIKVQEPVKKTE